MTAFWTLSKRMLHYKWMLMWAFLFALLSAGGLGAGLMSLGPLMRLILEDGQSLAAIAISHNASEPFIAVPGWIVAQLPTEPLPGVVFIISVLAGLTLLGALMNFMHVYLSQLVIMKTTAGIRRDCFRRVMHMPLALVVTRGPSEFVSRLVRDPFVLSRGMTALTSKSLRQVTKGIIAFLVAIWFSWKLALVALVVAPALAIILRKTGKRIRRGTRGSLVANEKLLRIATESISGIRAVKGNTGERETLAAFHRMNKESVRTEVSAMKARAAASPIVEALALIVIAGLAILAAKQILEGRLSFEEFLLSLGSLAVAGASFRPLTGLINHMQEADAPARRIMEILDLPREVSRDQVRATLPRHHESLELENVTFRYTPDTPAVLRDISLRVEHGERIAIVGPNGCGKTTLLALFPRLLVPESGRVLIDGVDIAGVNLRALRRQIGVVTQDTVLFRGSVLDNISFGSSRKERDRVIEAAKQAHADEFIRALPKGYDTELAEYGASLSGGQRQRLAIARAILRDPAILILDEATSQIDSESEAAINAAISEFSAGRTTLTIAHRLSTVLGADRTIVMDAGVVVDEGRHDDLVARCPVYRRLAEHQFLGGVQAQPLPTPGTVIEEAPAS